MIGDFGSSTKEENSDKDKNKRRKVFGLLEYMAPEMEYNIGRNKDLNGYSTEVDIYALGCML